MIKKLVVHVLLAISFVSIAAESSTNRAIEPKVSCPLGSAQSYDKTKCIECSPGYYSNIPNRSCTSSGNSQSSCCTVCPQGHKCPLSGTVTPTICPAGMASSYNRTTCVNCPAGFYSAEGAQCTSSGNSGQYCCKSCPPGHACPLPGTITPEMCMPGTAANYYNTACISCPVGFYTSFSGAQCTSSSNSGSVCCQSCPSGHACGNIGTAYPTMCVAGSSANYQHNGCLSCPVGYYSFAAAQCTSSSNPASSCCLTCPPGHVCSNVGTARPVQCQAGTAASFTQSVCLKCDAGYYSFDSAQCTSAANTAAVCCK